MATDGSSPSSDRRGFRRLLLLSPPKPSAADRNPLIPPPSSPPPQAAAARRFGFAAAALRGLGCASASSSQAFAPAAAAVRSSADWQGKRPRRRRGKKKKERRGQVSDGDVWCAPGIPFSAEASVDCVVAHQPMVGRGRLDIAERINRERPYLSRRTGYEEDISSYMDSSPDLDEPLFGHDLIPPGHLRQFRGYRRTPGGLEEMMMFQSRVLMGSMDVHDRYHDWRLDVDNMSYEELLELGDKIGYVSTGLREDEIIRSLRKVKNSVLGASKRQTSIDIEWKCSICQEEYGVSDEVGRLACGHGYHVYCIKQWLLRKNACPVCKTAVAKT